MTDGVHPYDPERDLEAAHRIWRECGWSDGGESDRETMARFTDSGRSWVHRLRGAAEVQVIGHAAELRYQGRALSLGVVSAVVASRIARKGGLASRLTAHLTADLAAQGLAGPLEILSLVPGPRSLLAPRAPATRHCTSRTDSVRRTSGMKCARVRSMPRLSRPPP